MLETMDALFSATNIGDLTLRNRFVMAPMTRNRASADGIQGGIAVTYYEQRASAGLVVTEGVQPSDGGQGYPRTPGIAAGAQADAWRPIVDAVHTADGIIAMQLMHCGRIAHSANRRTSEPPVAPSAIRASGQIWTDQHGLQPFAVPQELSRAGIVAVLDEYRLAARKARSVGFDGVELHATSGYLPMQFLSSNSNRRGDAYGGSAINRCRFVIEALEAMSDGFGGAGRVGVRLSPGLTFNDMLDDAPEETYETLASALNPLRLGYVHVVRAPVAMRANASFDPVAMMRRWFLGSLVAAGGFDPPSAATTVGEGAADAVAFGRLFLANPDLVARVEQDAPLAGPDESTFYTPGSRGYIDYPNLREAQKPSQLNSTDRKSAP